MLMVNLLACSPVDSRSGDRIVASGIKTYLWRRDLVWVCFCALKSGQPLSTRIVDALETGHTYSYCHYYPSRCGFCGESGLLLVTPSFSQTDDNNSQFDRDTANCLQRVRVLKLADR